jgi:hypothetical protein
VTARGGISITSSLELELLKTERKTVAGDANVMIGRIVQRTSRRVAHADIFVEDYADCRWKME